MRVSPKPTFAAGNTKYVFEDLSEFDTETLAAARRETLKYESEPIQVSTLFGTEGYTVA